MRGSLRYADGAEPALVRVSRVRILYSDPMDLHGSLPSNLTSALQSARRLRGHRVHSDTLGYWTELLHHARRELAAGTGETLLPLIVELEKELADRSA